MKTFQVKTEGRLDSEHKSEKTAIRNCGEGSVVVMVVKSGTYESRTVVYPEYGETRSN